MEIKPKNADVWYNKGIALHNLGKYNEAIKCYDKVLEIDPNYALIWNSKASSYVRLKEYDKAIELYSKAIELEPVLYTTEHVVRLKNMT